MRPNGAGKDQFDPETAIFCHVRCVRTLCRSHLALDLLVKVQPNTPRIALLLLVVINLIPVTALVVFARGHNGLAGALIVVPFGVALAVGSYTHFLSVATDNMFRMPPDELRLPFQVSAVLLAVLETAGCWIGLRMFIHGRE